MKSGNNMEKIKSVNIVYFTGTKGTELIAENISDAFERQEIKVFKTELNVKKHAEINADLLILLYPVYDFNAPIPVDEWIAHAQLVNGSPAAVISVSGGGEISPNTACRVDVIRQLEKNGYHVFYENMLVMPSNIVVSYNDVLCDMILRILPYKVEGIVSEILSGKMVRSKPHLVDRLFSKLGVIGKNYGKTFAKKVKVNEKCIGCSWCRNNCPRDNITNLNNKPVFGTRCVICLRCIYGCPQKAIDVSGIMGRFFVLKNGYNLKALEQHSQQLVELPPVSQIAKGYKFKGVRKYLSEK